MIRPDLRPLTHSLAAVGLGASLLGGFVEASAAPIVRRLTPPSALFTYGDNEPPIIARFLPGQRFDLQATITPDKGATLRTVEFLVDGSRVEGTLESVLANAAGVPPGTVSVTLRSYSAVRPGVHQLKVRAIEEDGRGVARVGNFEIVKPGHGSERRAKNIIICIGDGMGIAHRTAARLVRHGALMGKANAPLAMDTFPYTAIVTTHSLNSIVTDSSPRAACYSTGNKSNNNQQGVFPDDTTDNFDNPRVELIGEYLARTEGRSLGIVTTADVFDATPGAFGSHTQARSAGTGICDQYLDEMVPKAGLKVLMGGGRKWFLPSTTPGSARSEATDYVLPANLAASWGVASGALDKNRDLIAAFEAAGFTYASSATELAGVPNDARGLLGLFSLSNMNVAKDKIDGRRGVIPSSSVTGRTVVEDFGFNDQPMLDKMAERALDVLQQNQKGFVLMLEGASIDKQAHNMDTERWILDTIEFDRAIGVCKTFAEKNPETLVIVTADHECAGINIIGASTVDNNTLKTRAAANAGPGVDANYNGRLDAGDSAGLRFGTVGTYDLAGFPVYPIADDGYPVTTDPDRKMLIGYAANADRNETWLTQSYPLKDSQQPFNPPQVPASAQDRNTGTGMRITGQVPDAVAAHTASDIPLSAFGAGASKFHGVLDNTDVFFMVMEAASGNLE